MYNLDLSNNIKKLEPKVSIHGDPEVMIFQNTGISFHAKKLLQDQKKESSVEA